VRKIMILSVLSCFAVMSCTSSEKTAQTESSGDRNIAAAYFEELFSETAESCSAADYVNCNKRKSARELSSKEIQDIASSTNLNLGSKIQSAELIIDNDESFDKKLEAIKSARKEIRMVYFIYGNDDSSSLISNALIEKAKEGVRVKLLVDFITNYKNFDLFSMMMKEGNGNIDIRFYNFPSERLRKDAVFTTLSCPKGVTNPSSKECYGSKQNRMKSLDDSTLFSKLFLGGLYGKSATALKVSMGLGAQVTPDDFKKKEGEEEIEADQIKDFFKLLYEAKVKGNFFSLVKLQFSMIAYGSQINPILDKITGHLPVIDDGASKFPVKQFEQIFKPFKVTHADEWDHLTDYVHHKLIVVDGQEFQLGGRNIEDSYHMKSRVSGSGKYIFKDTDFHAKTAPGGARQIEASFDRMFNFTNMVATASTVNKYAPIKYINNPEALGIAAKACGEKMAKGLVKEGSSLDQCLITTIEASEYYKKDDVRFADVKSKMTASVQTYNEKYAKAGKKVAQDNWRQQKTFSDVSDDLSTADLKSSEMYYFENTPYDVDVDKKAVRRVGSRVNKDHRYNKNIHQLWYKELENSCRVSQNENRDVHVVFHNAYLILPAGLTYSLAKMMNGTYGDCSRVKVTFLTNSIETTDLNVINIFSRYQMIQLFKYYQGIKNYEKTYLASNLTAKQRNDYKRWYPKIQYYEYKASHMGSGISLHTKLALFGDDLFVGSANLDVRSYFMDTNNGLLIRNAHDLNKNYLKFIEDILADKDQTLNLSETFVNYTEAQVQKENDMLISMLLARWDKKGRVNPERKAAILDVINKLGSHISFIAYNLLTYKGGEDYVDMFNETEKYDSETKFRLRKMSNEFNGLFKTL
jgi:cardiolipin synthase C